MSDRSVALVSMRLPFGRSLFLCLVGTVVLPEWSLRWPTSSASRLGALFSQPLVTKS